MSLVLDLLIVGVVLLFIFFGIRKGFVASLVEVVGTLLAIVIAFSLSIPLSEAVYDSFVASRYPNRLITLWPDIPETLLKRRSTNCGRAIAPWLIFLG